MEHIDKSAPNTPNKIQMKIELKNDCFVNTV